MIDTEITKQNEHATEVEIIRKDLRDARSKGKGPLLGAFFRLSGPGFMQSALSLGGGSLAASLYLGILGGTEFLWLQPMASLTGIVMLCAVSYVVLSTGENPFKILNDHISPVVAWGWLLGAGIASLVWAFPQFSLATAVVRVHLLPVFFGEGGFFETGTSQIIIVLTIALICISMVWAYDAGIRAAKTFDYLLKALIAIMFLAFFGVLVRVLFEEDGIVWSEILSGLIPDFSLLFSPVDAFSPYLAAVDAQYRDFWTGLIASEQRDLIIGTAAVVVGVNSTVLLSYSMIKKGWDRDFRGLSFFDLCVGFFVPFVLITGCMVIVSSTLFHTETVTELLDEEVAAPQGITDRYEGLLLNRVMYEFEQEGIANPVPLDIENRIAALDDADRYMAAMLVDRDVFHLSRTLEPLTGDLFSRYIFGIGVLGLAMSTLIIQMVTWGFVTCEMLHVPKQGWIYRWGSLVPALGVLAPFIWAGRAQAWLVVPTSVFVATLLPIAYFSFAYLMNSKTVLGQDMPMGGKRVTWNTLMAFAATFASFGALWSMWSRLGLWTIAVIASFLLLIVVVNIFYYKRQNFGS